MGSHHNPRIRIHIHRFAGEVRNDMALASASRQANKRVTRNYVPARFIAGIVSEIVKQTIYRFPLIPSLFVCQLSYHILQIINSRVMFRSAIVISFMFSKVKAINVTL